MDIIRKNTDYALRLMVNLAGNYGEEVKSSRKLAGEEKVPYYLACKLLQKLNDAGIVGSKMGPAGGFYLSKSPAEVTLAMVINIIQGPISLNSCLLGVDVCPNQPACPISKKLSELQNYIENFLKNITLKDLLEAKGDRVKIDKKGN